MGSWLVDELIKRGHQVVSADNLLGGNERNVNRECKFVKADMRIRDRVSEVVKGVDVIFHLAAYAAEGQSFFSPVAINEINIVPMNNLLVEAINNGVESFVFTSSMAVYGAQKPPFREDLPREPEDPPRRSERGGRCGRRVARDEVLRRPDGTRCGRDGSTHRGGRIGLCAADPGAAHDP